MAFSRPQWEHAGIALAMCPGDDIERRLSQVEEGRQCPGAPHALSSCTAAADGEALGAEWSSGLCQDADMLHSVVGRRRKSSEESLESKDSTFTASTADVALSDARGTKLSPAAGRTSSLLQRRGRRSSTLSVPGAKQDYREALRDEGYDVGATIGRSRVNRGFSVVVARKDGRLFAAKSTAECAGAGVLAATLRHEFDILRRLSHPGLVGAEAFVDAAAGCAMVMELCPGVCLEQLMPQGSVVCGHGRHAVLGQILGAVAYLHGQQVAHRDIHALNVMADLRAGGGDPSVKILDFGSARVGPEAFGGAGELGDLEDVNPEILPPACATVASARDLDVFAVGLLAVGMLVGRPAVTAHVFTSEAVSVPDGFLVLTSAGKRHLISMLALESRPAAQECQTALPSSDRWLA